MAFHTPGRPTPASSANPEGGGRLTARLRLEQGTLEPLLHERLKRAHDQVAFDYLTKELSVDVLDRCVKNVSDQELTEFLLEHVFQVAFLLSSEALFGIEDLRSELKALSAEMSFEDAGRSRLLFDRSVEKLGKYFFALGRRLHQLEQSMAACPLSGSAEQKRGLYGQRVRDLAGDVGFMRQGLARWVQRHVPLERPRGGVDPELLEGRLDAVVDEIDLRLREVRDTLKATILEQLRLFEPGLTQERLFRSQEAKPIDPASLLETLVSLFEQAKAFDEERQPGQLSRLQALLDGLSDAHVQSITTLRESDHELFMQCVESLKGYEIADYPRDDDPIQVFLLLTGDFIARLRRQQEKSSETS